MTPSKPRQLATITGRMAGRALAMAVVATLVRIDRMRR